ncbi:MAG: PA2779 family protein [Thermodesulfobacteriota bacterium]
MLIKSRIYKISIIIIILSSFIPASLISKSAEGAIINSKILSSRNANTESREVSLTKIRKMLENKLVAEKLRSHGLSTEEVNQKLDKMGDAQIHQLAALSDKITAGGDGGVAIAVVVLVVFVIVIILLIVLRRI